MVPRGSPSTRRSGSGAAGRTWKTSGTRFYLDPASTNQATEVFEAAPVAGIYYLKIDLNRAITADMELAVGTDRRPPPSAQEIGISTEEVVYAALCQRLHGDCSAACSRPDFYCGGSVDECQQVYARSAVESLFDRRPYTLDRAKAEACAAEIGGRACGDLGSSSGSCADLVVNECAADPQSFARPWAGRMASQVALPAALDLSLCDGVGQFFRIDLAEGQRLVMRTDRDLPTGSAYARLYPPSASDEDLLDEDNYYFYAFYLSSSETVSDPVPSGGTFYLETEYSADGPVHLELDTR